MLAAGADYRLILLLLIWPLPAISQGDGTSCSLSGGFQCEEQSVTGIASGVVRSYGKGRFDVEIDVSNGVGKDKVVVSYDYRGSWVFEDQQGEFLEDSEIACKENIVRARQGANRIFILKDIDERPSYEFELFQRYTIIGAHLSMVISYGRCDRVR